MRLTRALIASMMIAAASCLPASDVLDPDPADMSLRYGHTGSQAAPGDVTNPPTVAGRDGAVEVRGILEAPDPCQTLTARHQRTATTVALRITVERNAEMCVAMIGTFAYVATIPGLETGEYRLTVDYVYPNTGWPTNRAVDTTVQVR